jgi:hypothetical protein
MAVPDRWGTGSEFFAGLIQNCPNLISLNLHYKMGDLFFTLNDDQLRVYPQSLESKVAGPINNGLKHLAKFKLSNEYEHWPSSERRARVRRTRVRLRRRVMVKWILVKIYDWILICNWIFQLLILGLLVRYVNILK